MDKTISMENLRTLLACISEQFVQKKEGFGLSSNDFSDKYKERLKNMDTDAEKNVIVGIEVGGEELGVEEDRVARFEAVTEEDILKIADEAEKDIKVTGGSL